MNSEQAIKIVQALMDSSVPELNELDFGMLTSDTKRRTKELNQQLKKDALDYFGKKYTAKIGGIYRKSNISDNKSINEILLFLHESGLDKWEYYCKFIDWCMDRKVQIVNEKKSVTLQTILHYLNQFYQDTILPNIEDGQIQRQVEDINIIKDIKEIEKSSPAFNIFVKYGIPVGVTYFTKVKMMPKEEIVNGIKTALKKYNNDPSGKQKVSLVFKKSILNSPYPKEMIGLDWREMFEQEANYFKKENWWRDTDYKGQPLPMYQKLIS